MKPTNRTHRISRRSFMAASGIAAAGAALPAAAEVGIGKGKPPVVPGSANLITDGELVHPITQFPGERLFYERVNAAERAIELTHSSRRTQGDPISLTVVAIRLSNFDQILREFDNHPTAKPVIQQVVARRLSRILSDAHTRAHLREDEFALLFINELDIKFTVSLLERTLRLPFRLMDREITLAPKLGAATKIPLRDKSFDAIDGARGAVREPIIR